MKSLESQTGQSRHRLKRCLDLFGGKKEKIIENDAKMCLFLIVSSRTLVPNSMFEDKRELAN